MKSSLLEILDGSYFTAGTGNASGDVIEDGMEGTRSTMPNILELAPTALMVSEYTVDSELTLNPTYKLYIRKLVNAPAVSSWLIT